MKRTITQILDTKNKQMSPTKKITAIKGIVQDVRRKYGNKGKKLGKTVCNTTNGSQSIKYVSDEDKLALVVCEVDVIRSQAINDTECTKGVVFERRVEELIATSALLSNLGKKVESAYL